ncbi:MAG: LysR family transcriptional regulator [Rhizomicrobium sp.]|nr:LysR family transcriptional regulator [Rhizomicrobium sp.]
MDRLEAMRIFARVVERTSFSAAARDLHLPASKVTEAVKQLEARLGVRLIERTTRVVRPTPDGEAYHRRCLLILGEIEDAEGSLRGAKPSGPVRVDVQGGLARAVLFPSLPAFFAEYPEIELTISETDRFVDPLREGIDCVLRAGEVKDGDLVARRLALLPEVTCCSPAYIARYGMPQSWDALEGHCMIGFRSSASGGVLPLEFMVGGEKKTVMLPSALTVDSAESYSAAVLLGLGLVQSPRYPKEEAFARGTLLPVLEDTPPSPTPVSLLYAGGRLLSPRVRVFIDWVTQCFNAANL